MLKPIDADVLRAKVSSFVELYQKGERFREHEAALHKSERERLEERCARILVDCGERYRSLVLATTDIVWTADPHGNVAADSPSWMAFTGQKADQHRGLGWLEALHPDDREATRRRWLAAVASKEAYAAEHRLKRSDGSYAFMSASAVPIFDTDGSVREWFGAATDISERKRAEQDRERSHELERQAHALAEHAVAVRDEFFSIASHELNTPLAPLKLHVAMLRRESDPEKVAARAAAIERQVDRLAALVSRLLDVTRMSTGPLALEVEESRPRAPGARSRRSLQGRSGRRRVRAPPALRRPGLRAIRSDAHRPGFDQPSVECAQVRSGQPRRRLSRGPRRRGADSRP